MRLTLLMFSVFTVPATGYLAQFFPLNFFRERGACAEMSGKFELAARMLTMLRHTTTDRIVIVSVYTQTLDLFSALCRERVSGLGGCYSTHQLPGTCGMRRSHHTSPPPPPAFPLQSWPCIRLDGSTTASKRQKLVDKFNEPKNDEFVFLLSSKAYVARGASRGWCSGGRTMAARV
jgi:DNA repair and recombination RAD54-like protein